MSTLLVVVAQGWPSTLFSEGRWFDSPGLHAKVSLGKILNHLCMNYCKLFWTKASAKRKCTDGYLSDNVVSIFSESTNSWSYNVSNCQYQGICLKTL